MVDKRRSSRSSCCRRVAAGGGELEKASHRQVTRRVGKAKVAPRRRARQSRAQDRDGPNSHSAAFTTRAHASQSSFVAALVFLSTCVNYGTKTCAKVESSAKFTKFRRGAKIGGWMRRFVFTFYHDCVFTPTQFSYLVWHLDLSSGYQLMNGDTGRSTSARGHVGLDQNIRHSSLFCPNTFKAKLMIYFNLFEGN